MDNQVSAWDQLSPQSAQLLLCDLQKHCGPQQNNR
jgi:hypothetical protein